MEIEINDRELDLICHDEIYWAIKRLQERCECSHKEARDAVYAVYHDLHNVKNPPKYAGSFEKADLPFKRGDEVIIPKGAKIHTTHPSDDGNKVAGRSYKVKVHRMCEGVHPLPGYYAEPQNPKVIWAGTGGYWCEVDVNDLLEANGK